MGKNRVIKSLGKNIGNIVVHKILEKYTNNPEAINHLKHEVIAYQENVIKITKEFNWNKKDREEIRLEAIECFKKEMALDYSDVGFPMSEAERLIEETLEDIFSE